MASLRDAAGRRNPPRLLASALDKVVGMDAKGLVAALRQSEERYRLLVERLPGIVYIDEPGAQGRYISPQIQSILGYSAAEWLEDPDRWAEALHPEDRDRATAELTAGEQSGKRFTSEYRLLARDGRVVWFRDEATPTHDDDGRLLVHGVMFDVTREREIEAELAAEVAERAEVATALSSFHGGADPVATSRGLTREMLRLRHVDIAALYAFHGDARRAAGPPCAAGCADRGGPRAADGPGELPARLRGARAVDRRVAARRRRLTTTSAPGWRSGCGSASTCRSRRTACNTA